MKSLSRFRLFVTPWTAAHQASSSMGFSRQEYWSAVPLPSLYLVLVTIKNNYGKPKESDFRIQYLCYFSKNYDHKNIHVLT